MSRQSSTTIERRASAAATSSERDGSSRSARSHGTNPRCRNTRASGKSATRRIRGEDGRACSSHSTMATTPCVQMDCRAPRAFLRASNRCVLPRKPKSRRSPSACARVHDSVHDCCSARVPAASILSRTLAPVARSSAARGPTAFRPKATRHKNRSAISEAMRRTHLCNRLACENRPGLRWSSTEQCRKFV